MGSQVYFVENLTLRAWVWSVWPRLLCSRLRTGRRVTHCYIIDGSRLVILFARLSAGILAVAVEKLAFRLVDVRDEEGRLIRLRLAYQDLTEVQQYAMTEPVFQQLVQREPSQDRLPMFVAKNMAVDSVYDRRGMWRALLVVQLCVWKKKQERVRNSVPVLFLERRPWLKAIRRYASTYDVAIISVPSALNVSAFLRRRLPPEIINLLRFLRYRRQPLKELLSSLKPRVLARSVSTAANGPLVLLAQDSSPRVAVEYLGHLNLHRPELYSDLFFQQRSSLAGSNILLMFSLPGDPLDEKKLTELKELGISVAVLHPGATTIPGLPVFNHHTRFDQTQRGKHSVGHSGLETAWLTEQMSNYRRLRAYWTDLFVAYNVKVYTTWFKYNGTHCAIADALQDLGGVTAIYQRAYESDPSANTTIGADIVFGFSQSVAEVERRSNSIIRYHVTTGYLGDHRFPLLRNNARTVRDTLKGHGAMRILSFSDEWSGDDSRWHTGHQFMRENYLFLLEKVLAEPWLGLLIKPKSPNTLRRRLGPVAETLERAEATGRCYVYEGGAMHGSHTPAEAALAADIAIHGHLCGATAGLEAALAGVPTLLLDREGWPVSSLYRLGVGRVVFKGWDTLWDALVEHWASPGGIPGFGDWSPMFDELDPFRDGRAAERMGTYIQWLIEGFKAGLDRETVMADAAERYCEIWGKDKVTEVRGGLGCTSAPHSGERR
jgi:hypothetical protein